MDNDDDERLSADTWESRTLGDPSANVSVHVPRGHNHNPPTNGGNQNGNEEQNAGVEIGDGVRWLERNAIFIILLLVKFAWYHRSGKRRLCVCVCVCERERERERNIKRAIERERVLSLEDSLSIQQLFLLR